MKNGKQKMKRLLSVLLCLALVVSFVPGGLLRTSAATVTTGGQTVDDHTLDQWKQYFGQQQNHPNRVNLSTEFAGGVWTDKSVFDPANLPAQLTGATYNGTGVSIADEGDNFLVALSAIASNKEIVGYSTIPTDTVLILDLSSSMRSADDNRGSAVDELVEATNKAITDLLRLNRNNRIAVVVYAGNTNRSFSNAGGATRVILPLDSYTTTTAGTYLRAQNNDQALAVISGVRNSAGQAVTGASFEVATGTFMQDGIYEAMKIFLAADPVVEEGVQKGTNRLPIMVLMTDGEPTLANPDYNGNDARTDLGNTTMNDYSGSTGNVTIGGSQRTSYTHRDTIAFVTSLTAAFVKKSVEAHYGTEGLLYTLPYGSAVLSRAEALSVLNPAQASNVQNTLWNHFLNGEAVPVYRYRQNYGGAYSYYYVSNSSAASEKLTAADRLYVDKYFPAANDAGMLQAFEDIVEEIVIQSKYYPTYVEKDHDHDGYLTFVDKIGAYMEVSDVEGIVVGDRLFSGAALAAKFTDGSLGTVDNPTATGNALIDSIMIRLNIDDRAVAKALAVSAYTHGQLSYTSDQDFSHYLGWFSDADGNYVDFWHGGMTDAQVAEVAAKKGATHVIRSYIFLGDTTVVPGVNNTDMMYMSVRVATDIATMQTIVTWRVPASLVPTVTYEVEVEVDSNGKIVRLMKLDQAPGSADSPIRLLYEVGLRSDITDWNLAEKVDAAYVKANGYTFYSNKWDADPDDVSLNTYSHFEPSVQNERYYYTQDTAVLVKNGETYSPYTGSKPAGDGYWHSLLVYEKLTDGTLRTHTHYEPISAGAMEAVQADGSGWVIPKDTVHRYYDYEISPKENNTTGTMAYSDHPFVVKSGNTYYTYSTQGNNGKFTTTPATGIRLTKTLADGFASNERFTFVVGGNIASAQVVRLDETGAEASRSPLAATGEVTLTAGETVYIVGLTAGSYTVTEKVPVGANYHVQSVLVNGQAVGTEARLTLAEQTITPVEFINDEQGYGSLVVSKDVNYPAGFLPTEAHNAKPFMVDVTFTGNIASLVAPAGAVQNGSTYILALKDGQSVTFSNIKQGVTYQVTERELPAGYSLTEVRYSNSQKTVVSGAVDQAHVVNGYSLSPVSVPLKVTGTKTVDGTWPAGAAFTLRLMKVDELAGGSVVDTGLSATVTEGAATYEIDLSALTFDAEGTYTFLVLEDIPENRIPDMAYDRSFGQFSVTVTDADADGRLEIAGVNAYQGAELTGAPAGYTVTKNFVNTVTKDIVYLDVQKQVQDAAGGSYTDHLADITFGLFDSPTANTPAYYVVTGDDGRGRFAIPVSQASLGQAGKTWYLREIAPAVENRVVGMHYDESWIAAIRVSWDSDAQKAVAEYTLMKNGQAISWTPYIQGTTVIDHVNTYEPNVNTTPELVFSGKKTLNGGDDLGGRTFSFSLYRTSAAFVIQGNALQTVQNNGNAITFRGITFDTPGLHYLSVKEDPTTLGGISLDHRHYHITVLVEKYVRNDGSTGLRVADGYPRIAAYGETGSVAPDGLNFDNTYTVSGTAEAVIAGTKTLTGRPMLASEFRFRLVEVDAQGAPVAGGTQLLAENGPANGSAAFRFAPIVYTQPGTHYYQVTEIAGPAGDGVTYSDAVFTVTVEVTDNGRGGLEAKQTVSGGAALTFANSYKPADGSTGLVARKELTGKVLGDQQFSFRLLQTQQDFTTPLAGGVDRTVTNNSQGAIDFGTMYYAEEGTFYYLISEQIPATPEPGIVYDTTTYRVTVRVTDDHKGQLQTISSVEMVTQDEGQQLITPAGSIVFYNRYAADGEIKVLLQGTKTLSGKDLTDGMFTFELYETNGQYATEGVTPITDANLGSNFHFELTYNEENIGQVYHYVIRERGAGQTIDGITYSDVEYHVAVAVKDDGNGGVLAEIDGLTATREGDLYRVEGMEFHNSYEAEAVDVVLTVQKTMTGDKKDPSGFVFGLYTDLKGEPLTTVTSDADGVVSFEKLTASIYDVQAEPYVFYIREILPLVDGKPVTQKDNVTYDETIYTVKLTVTDDGKGKVLATYTVDDKAVDQDTYRFAFTNSYQKPEAVNPTTGDDMNLGLMAALLLASALGLICLPVWKKKR